jgi:hypothetical protein
MPERRRFTQTTSLEERLAELRSYASRLKGTSPGVERDLLVRKARRAETASRMTERLTSSYKHQDTFN